MIIWHNPNCSKSRECIKVLDERKVIFKMREYLIDTPSSDELQEVIKMMAITNVRDMMRIKEDEYNELDLSSSNKTTKDLIDAMVQYPKLIERPIGINNGIACVGRPLDNILDII